MIFVVFVIVCIIIAALCWVIFGGSDDKKDSEGFLQKFQTNNIPSHDNSNNSTIA